MISAIVMIKVKAGDLEALLRSLNSLPQTREVYTVYGIYDVILKLEVESKQELREIINRKIREIENVFSTVTMVVNDGPPSQMAMNS
ncbi:MAG TPA: Lrp/AsnC ligand binding domain-containing protein [Patescibacteria group bacterium]|nr:Lrp/AsnC ligand binding domain-containing protein [Patescibacteria group bacterium]